ncbi:MAG TPA: TonB-dependent receptor [Steroidobacteraceae bacterium]|nr:TonB-dependent receptor [Steroidobacteraceae bacterium]
MKRPGTSSRTAFCFFVSLSCVALAAQGAGATRSVESLLQELKSAGIDVIYNSTIVPPDLQASVDDLPGDPLLAASAALAAHGLELRQIGPRHYVVVRVAVAPASAPPPREAILAEVSVYASRFAIDGRSLAEPSVLAGPEINLVPGTHDDALRALKALPGLASNVSARPYIRGSLTEDVLIRYDGITLLDPYHLKNFQSLVSAIDPAAIDAIEVFSSGFPVQYGTRSGGVISMTAPTLASGYENRIGASAISAGASTLGRADRLPLEWFGAIRRSTLDLLEPVEDSLGEPQFSDSLGRLRWETAKGAWTVGWLLLDDELDLGAADDDEVAHARYRDEYLWLARDHRFGAALTTRLSAVLTTAERERDGTVNAPDVAVGSLHETQEFDRFELTNAWSYEASGHSSYSFGAELALTHADYQYRREVTFSPEVAVAFDRDDLDALQASIRPEAITYAVYAANRRAWADLEAEFGVRVDAQDFAGLGQHTQVSPRVNLRYDLTGRTSLYASAGRFTQAQHIEEWRVEEGQTRADPAQSSTHTVLGLTHETARSARWSIEAYSKRWTRISPYFDNTLNPLSLLPDLAPDRVRLAPTASETTGLEVNGRMPLFAGASAWGSLSWSRVADDFQGRDVLRSWDQSVATSAGFAWEGSRLSLSVLGGWHRGWPRTPYVLTQSSATAPGSIALGTRNSDRWANYLTLDVRGAWTWRFARADLQTTLELTNATNRENPCCTALEESPAGQSPVAETEDWLPIIVNLGFTYRWRNE